MPNVLLLGLTSLLTDIASEMVYPLVPFFLTTRLGASPAMLGVIEGLAESAASLLKVFSGRISDRLGDRKTPTILGYACSALGKLLLAVAAGWGLVLAGRVVDRVGKGIRTAPRDALVAESAAGGHGRAFGLHRALDSSGAVIGVMLGYLFFTRYTGDYARVFVWSLLPATAAVAVLFFVREPAKRRPLADEAPSLRLAALPPRLRWFLLITLLFTLGNSSNTFLLLRAENLGYSPATVLLLYLTFNVVYAVASYPAGRLSDRVGRKALLVGGYAVNGAVYLGFALVPPSHHSWLWGLFALYGLYVGLTDGVEKALITDLVPASIRATGIGLHATIVGVGLFPASLLAGQLWDLVGPQAVFYVGGATGLLAALGLLLTLRGEGRG